MEEGFLKAEKVDVLVVKRVDVVQLCLREERLARVDFARARFVHGFQLTQIFVLLAKILDMGLYAHSCQRWHVEKKLEQTLKCFLRVLK